MISFQSFLQQVRGDWFVIFLIGLAVGTLVSGWYLWFSWEMETRFQRAEQAEREAVAREATEEEALAAAGASDGLATESTEKHKEGRGVG